MEEEELQPQTSGERDLQAMSIEELESYIAEMKAEIGRVEEAIAAKKKFRHGAETVFRR